MAFSRRRFMVVCILHLSISSALSQPQSPRTQRSPPTPAGAAAVGNASTAAGQRGAVEAGAAVVEHKLTPVDISKLVTPWSDLGFAEYTFIGTRANTIYQATVWLRIFPTDKLHERDVRIVVQLTRAPDMLVVGKDIHATTPKEFLVGGKLPTITFTSMSSPRQRAEKVEVSLEYWEEYITSNWLASAINGRATLKTDTIYTLSMEGCQRLYQIPALRSSRANAIFQDGDVWIGVVESMVEARQPRSYQFMVLEHLRYHLRLGVRGTLLVVVPQTAALLLADEGIAEVVRKKQLVLVLWEHGHIHGAPYLMQLPGSNLLKAAMAGTNTTLGLWDLDEFLVLPRHRNVSYEVNHGCLTQLHDPANQEAVLSFSLALPPDSLQGRDINRWLKLGSFESAIKSVPYSMQMYKHCKWGVYCKALINPNSHHNMHVHQMVRREQDARNRNKTDPSCAYMHHFHHLWGRRSFWSPDILMDKAPLVLEDLPFDPQVAELR